MLWARLGTIFPALFIWLYTVNIFCSTSLKLHHDKIQFLTCGYIIFFIKNNDTGRCVSIYVYINPSMKPQK